MFPPERIKSVEGFTSRFFLKLVTLLHTPPSHPVTQRGGQPASLFGFGCQYKFSGGQNGFETENGLASPLPHTGRTSRWWPRRRLSLPPSAMSGAESLTPERVDQRSFTRSMVIDALVERGVSSASLAKP